MKTVFGTHKGSTIYKFVLKNQNGYEIGIINYGAIITNFIVPDKNKTARDIVLGFDTLDGYTAAHPYFGATIGRFANRIGKAAFDIDGTHYKISANEGNNSLHSGPEGFDKKVWDIVSESDTQLVLGYRSPDGEEGFPGNVDVRVIFTLTDDSCSIEYDAVTDRPTYVNLTNHSYFNLGGEGNGSVEDHFFTIHSDRITENDHESIPTGTILPVADGFYDLRTPQRLCDKLKNHKDKDYDINYILAPGYKIAAESYCENTGITLQLYTDQPGVQFYSGIFLDNVRGKKGHSYLKHHGFCFEPQHWPDAPNKADFPPTLLRPGMRYTQKSAFVIQVKTAL